MSAALAALRVVADWMSVCVRGLLPVHSYDLVTSCTADEEYMVSICLQKIRKRTKGCTVILLPISSYPPFDSQRVSRLLQLTGYVNRIRSDDEWISIALLPIIDPCLSVEPKLIQSLRSISAVIHSATAGTLCKQFTRTERIVEIFACAFCMDHQLLSLILRGVSTTLPFHLSVPGFRHKVNFVVVAWLIEARGFSVFYRYGDTECIVDAVGVYPACCTWCRIDERLSLFFNKPPRALAMHEQQIF